MTELIARLAPGATLDQARAELRSVYLTMKKNYPEAYSKQGDFQISARLLRDQLTSGARNVLLVLLVASAFVFIIACSNVANLIDVKDVKGKTPVKDYITAALKDGSAWTEYYWYRPGENATARKRTYVRKVQFGADTYIVGSGVYLED